MDVIEIKYRPFKSLRLTKNYICRVPNQWKEAEPKHLLAISKFALNLITEREFINDFCSMPIKVFKKLTDFELYNIAQLITLVNSRPPFEKFILKLIEFKDVKLIAPKARLEDVTFGNFVMFDSYFMEVSERNEASINKFVAYLFSCTLYDSKDIAILLKGVDKYIKYALYLNYSLIRAWLTKRYTYLFKAQEKEKKKADNKQPKKEGKKNNWLPILDSLISNDLANADKYEKLPLHTVLRKLNNDIKNAYKNGKI